MTPDTIVGEALWGLEAGDQGVMRVDFSRGLSSWLVDEPSRFSVSSLGLPAIPVCVQISCSYNDTHHIGLGPTLMI